MKHYLLSIYQPDGEYPEGNPPPAEILDPIMRDINAVNDEMKSAGVWVFGGGLHPPLTATVLGPTESADQAGSAGTAGAEPLITDGPYIEGKEHIGGFTIIRVADLDSALEWGRKLAKAIRFLPIEVRPFQDGAGG
jgi:hypothetical protein